MPSLITTLAPWPVVAVLALAGCTTAQVRTTIADACAGLAVAHGAVAVYTAAHPADTRLARIAADVAAATGPACTAPYPSTDAEAVAAVLAGAAQLTGALAGT